MGGGGRGMRVVDRARRRSTRPLEQRPPRGRRPRSATRHVFLEKLIVARRGTSRCRSSATRTATSCTSSSATARSSAATRRWSRSPRRRTSTPALRDRICDRRREVRAAHVGYVNAGTVEFLVDADDGRATTSSRSTRASRSSTPSPRGRPASTSSRPDPRSPRARDADRPEIGIDAGRRSASAASRSSAAITTEDPANDFRPDYGRSPPTARRAAPASGSTAARPTSAR